MFSRTLVLSMPARRSSMPGVSITATRCPLTSASMALISLVHERRPFSTLCCWDVMLLMNYFEKRATDSVAWLVHPDPNVPQTFRRRTVQRYYECVNELQGEDAQTVAYATIGTPDSISCFSRRSFAGSRAGPRSGSWSTAAGSLLPLPCGSLT